MEIPEIILSPPVVEAVWPAIIAGVAALGGAAYNAISNKKAQKRQNQANKQLAEYQFQQNQEMWELQNQYNDPSAQMSRLQGAGLNPNMIYGSGNAPGNQSGSAPTYDRPEMHAEFSPLNITSAIGAYQNFEMRQAQIDQVKAVTENTNQRTLTEHARSGLTGLQYREKRALEPYFDELAKTREQKSRADLSTELQRVKNMSAAEQTALLQNQYKMNAIDQQQIDKERKQAQLLFEQHRASFAKDGIHTSDNIFLRLMIRMLNDMSLNPFDMIKNYFGK